MNRFRISGFGLRRAGLLGAAVWLIGASILASPTSPTPTPLPRLSGGFGRPRATPSPAVPAVGQSLADVVRAAQQGWNGEKPAKSGLTINNQSLVTNPDKGRVSTSRVGASSSAPSASTPPVPAGQGSPSPEAEAAAPASAGTEAEWRAIFQRAKQRLEDARERVAELEATSKKLESDFYAWDDGHYRDRVIKPAWDRTLRQLGEARRELADAEQEQADLPERARKAGALPGWLRE